MNRRNLLMVLAGAMVPGSAAVSSPVLFRGVPVSVEELQALRDFGASVTYQDVQRRLAVIHEGRR